MGILRCTEVFEQKNGCKTNEKTAERLFFPALCCPTEQTADEISDDRPCHIGYHVVQL